MTNSDTDDMADLEAAYFSEPWSKKQIEFELTNEKAVYFCAVIGEKTIGFAGMHNIVGEGYITNVAVNEHYRRTGIAKKLLTLLCEYAEQNDMCFITLEARVSNAPAIALYENMGFKKDGIRKRFYSMPDEDALIMTKRF